jgi:DNA polymerase III alpha subunit
MIKDNVGQYIYTEEDMLDIVMRNLDNSNISILVNDISDDNIKNINKCKDIVTKYTEVAETIEEFDKRQQENWYLPDKYKELDIAKYVLSLCTTQDELQRCGDELIMFQDRNLFNLLKYMKYLVDTMVKNNIIWGVGRGSSVSSYVLYKMKVHKVNSMYYKLNVDEFLR